jgi:hypothetical protein
VFEIKLLEFYTVFKAVHLHNHVLKEINLHYVSEIFECWGPYKS